MYKNTEEKNIEYLGFFYLIITMGLSCKLNNPLHMLANAYKLSEEGETIQLIKLKKEHSHIIRFLHDIYFTTHNCKQPHNGQEILDWYNGHLSSTHAHYGLFDSLLPKINKYLKVATTPVKVVNKSVVNEPVKSDERIH